MRFNPNIYHSYYSSELKECNLTQKPCWKQGFNCDSCDVVIKPKLRNATVTEKFLQEIDTAQKREEVTEKFLQEIDTAQKREEVTEKFLQEIDTAQKREELTMRELLAAQNKPFKKKTVLDKILKLLNLRRS